jgi:hypothetical protein
MNSILKRILSLVSQGEVRVSEHGYDDLASDEIFVRDLTAGLPRGELLEAYPDFPKGPCVLILQQDRGGKPVYVVWGIPKGKSGPAVLVTAYRPDPKRWTEDFRSRKT